MEQAKREVTKKQQMERREMKREGGKERVRRGQGQGQGQGQRQGQGREGVEELAERGTADFSKSAADYYVPSLPGLPNLSSHRTHPLTVHAGIIPSYAGASSSTTTNRSALFFLKINSRKSAGANRVIFWFNGGPGCSSFDGALMEVGPFRTIPAEKTESGQVELRLVEGGWEEFATVVFVDQPAGTGLSYAPTDGYLSELDQASSEFLTFLENFYQVFPEMRWQDTYLAGESFAGQYIPYFASALLNVSSSATSTLTGFPLKGIAIGNGWMDPREQYRGYSDFAYEKGLIKKGSKEAQALDSAMATCQTVIDIVETPNAFVPVNIDQCYAVMDAVTAPYSQQINDKSVCMNVYDVRLIDDWPACGMNWPPDLPDVYQLLRRKDVLASLHATAKETAWVECDNQVSSHLSMQHSPASALLFPSILDAGVKVLLFAGDEDLICNYVGVERTAERIVWNGGEKRGLKNATEEEWVVNGTLAGSWKKAGGLEYVRVFGGSHMIGYDLPHVTNDMIIRFLDVDYAALAGTTAMTPSKLGEEGVHQLIIATQEGKEVKDVDWNMDSRVHAGSAILIFLLLAIGISGYFYLRARSRKRKRYAGYEGGSQDVEDEIPLGDRPSVTSRHRDRDEDGYGGDEEEHIPLETTARDGKYKAREVVFDIGEE